MVASALITQIMVRKDSCHGFSTEQDIIGYLKPINRVYVCLPWLPSNFANDDITTTSHDRRICTYLMEAVLQSVPRTTVVAGSEPQV